MSQEVAVRKENEDLPAITDPQLLQQFQSMVMQLPSEEEGGSENIIRQLLAATSLDDLNKPWESTDAKRMKDHILRFNSVLRRPSDFKGGLGIFLVCRVVDTNTGEDTVYTTGSISCVVQLVQAYLLGYYPFFAKVIVAERPTEQGFYPHHLEFISRVKEPALAENVEA